MSQFILPRCLAILILVLLGTLAYAEDETSGAVLAIGNTAPPWQGVDLISRDTVTFPEILDSRPAVLVFWASWCPYCRAFMPYTKAIQEDYGAEGVKIITLNAKERGRGDPVAYARSLGFPMIAIEEADAIAERYGVKFVPGLMVVDGAGDVVYRRRSTNKPPGRAVSQQWDEEVRRALDALLARSSEGK